MHIVEAEFRRRKERGEVIWKSIKAEAEHLAAWFENVRVVQYPDAPGLTAGTIETRIRVEYHEAKKAARAIPTK